MKKGIIFIIGLLMMMSVVNAAPFNLPIEWVLQPNGTTIDSNSNGWPDYADNVLNASYAGTSADAELLNGQSGSYYLNYDNMNAGSIPDGYIDSAATWNAKAGAADCPAGYVVQNTTSSGVECVANTDTTYSAGAHLSLVGTTFSVDITNLGSALDNSVLSSYQNITNLPTCDSDEMLSYDGTTLTCEHDSTGSDTQLTEEQVQDFAWNVLGGTQTGIDVVYNDTTNTVDFIVTEIGGAVNVSDLGDVSLNSLSNGEALVYNSTSGLWENSVIIADLTNYYNKTEVEGLPVSTFTNDAGYLTSYTETDPVWTAASGNYYLKTETYNKSEIDDAISSGSGVWNISGSDIYYNGGNVGIGTDSPTSALDVDGNINIHGVNGISLATKGDTTDYSSTIIGNNAGDNITDGSTLRQTAIGSYAGSGNTDEYQTAIGYSAGNDNTGAQQTAIGGYAGLGNIGYRQTAIGYNAGKNNIGNYQTAIGHVAGYDNSGAQQTAIGYVAGYENTGAQQTASGYGAGRDNTGDIQTASGYYAGRGNTGDSQTAIGYYAGHDNTGDNVIGIGYESTYQNNASDVVAIGYQAGKENQDANQFIVQQANINSDPLIQGDFSSGDVGIGTTSPQNKLDVEGGVAVGSTYSGTNTAPTNGLIVEGNVGIGTNSPTSALDVDGDIKAKYITGTSAYKSDMLGDNFFIVQNPDDGYKYFSWFNSTGSRDAYFGLDNNKNFIFKPESSDTIKAFGDLFVVGGLNVDDNIVADNFIGSGSGLTGLDYFTGADITGSETAFDGWDKDASNDFSGSWNDLTDVPAGFADDVDNDTWVSESSNYYNKTQVYNTTEVYTKTESDNNFVDVSGDTMTGDLNMSDNNVTSVDCITFNSGGQICSAS